MTKKPITLESLKTILAPLTHLIGKKINKDELSPVATSGSYNDLTNKPTLATVARSGSYNDLTNKPTLATVARSGSYNDLTNKPTLATVATSGSYNDLIDSPLPYRSYFETDKAVSPLSVTKKPGSGYRQPYVDLDFGVTFRPSDYYRELINGDIAAQIGYIKTYKLLDTGGSVTSTKNIYFGTSPLVGGHPSSISDGKRGFGTSDSNSAMLVFFTTDGHVHLSSLLDDNDITGFAEGRVSFECYFPNLADVYVVAEPMIPDEIQRVGDDVILNSSTEGSTKRFKLFVDDSGNLTATEVT